MNAVNDSGEIASHFAPVDPTPEGFEVTSQHAIPEGFRDLYGKQHKVLLPSLLSVAAAFIIILFAPIDFIYALVLAAVVLIVGVRFGSTRIKRIRKSIEDHPSVQSMSGESGIAANEIADHISVFALSAKADLIMPLSQDLKLYLNMGEYEADGSFIQTLPEPQQSIGLMRSTPAEA